MSNPEGQGHAEERHGREPGLPITSCYHMLAVSSVLFSHSPLHLEILDILSAEFHFADRKTEAHAATLLRFLN